MDGLTSLRQLQSGSINHEEKLQVACSLAACLLPAPAYAQLTAVWQQAIGSTVTAAPLPSPQQHSQPAVPAIVHEHYAQALFDWVVQCIVEAADTQNGTAQKQQQKQRKTGTLAHLDTRLWCLSAALLQAGATRVPSQLVSAASVACRHCAADGKAVSSGGSQALLQSISDLFKAALEANKGIGLGLRTAEWQPSLDTLTGLLSALEQMQRAQDTNNCTWHATWSALTLQVLQELLHSVHTSQNPKKVLTSILAPTALHTLLCMAFPQPSNSLALSSVLHLQTSTQSHDARDLPHQGARLSAAAQEVLSAVVLHDSHVVGLVEAGSVMVQPVLASLHQQPGTNKRPAEDAEQHAAGAQHATPTPVQLFSLDAARSYHSHVFQALHTAILSSAPGVRAAALGCLPWLLSAASTAISRERRVQAAEAASGMRSALQKSHQAGGGGEPDAGPLHQAEFHMFASLSCMLLRLLDPSPPAAGSTAGRKSDKQSKKAGAKQGGQQEQEQGKAQEQVLDLMAKSEVIHGLAALLSCAKASRAYEPTQDVSQVQRRFLTMLATSLLNSPHFSLTSQHHQPLTPHILVALCGVMCALLKLEYRTLTCDLPTLWTLLIQTACSDSSSSQVELGLETTGDGAVGVQVAVACMQQLVGAYSELRQFQQLLESLLTALGMLPPAEGSSASTVALTPTQHAYLSLLVTSTPVLVAIEQAVQALPSGQTPPLLHSLGRCLEVCNTTATTPAAPPHHAVLAAAAVTVTCIKGVKLDLPVSGPLAAACQYLVSQAATPLLSHLTQTCKRHVKQQKGQSKKDKGQATVDHVAHMVYLLQLYHEATRLHAHCVALNPEVSPLPGRAIWQPPTSPSAGPAAGEEQQEGGAMDVDDSGSGDDDAQATSGFFMAAIKVADDAVCAQLSKVLSKAAAAASDMGTGGAPPAVVQDALYLLMKSVFQPEMARLISTACSSNDEQHDHHQDATQVVQVALAHVVHQCVLHQASLLHERAMYLSAACMHKDDRPAMEVQLVNTVTQLKQLVQLAAPMCLWDSSCQDGQADDDSSSTCLPAWLSTAAAPGGMSHAQIAAQLSIVSQTGKKAELRQCSGALLLRGAWEGAMQVISLWGNYLPADSAQQLLQLMLATANITPDAVSHAQVGNVISSSSRQILGLPGWQSSPYVSQHLATAVAGVSCVHAQQLVTAERSVEGAAGTSRDSEQAEDRSAAGVLHMLSRALYKQQRGTHDTAGKKAGKAIKAQLKQFSAGDAGQQGVLVGDGAAWAQVTEAAHQFTSLQNSVLQVIDWDGLPQADLVQLQGHYLLVSALQAQLLLTLCNQAHKPSKGGSGVTAVGPAHVVAVLQSLGVSLQALHRVQAALYSATARVCSHATGVQPVVPLTQQVSWVQGLGQYLVGLMRGDSSPHVKGLPAAPASSVPAMVMSVVATSCQVLQGMTSLQLQQSRLNTVSSLCSGNGKQGHDVDGAAASSQQQLFLGVIDRCHQLIQQGATCLAPSDAQGQEQGQEQEQGGHIGDKSGGKRKRKWAEHERPVATSPHPGDTQLVLTHSNAHQAVLLLRQACGLLAAACQHCDALAAGEDGTSHAARARKQRKAGQQAASACVAAAADQLSSMEQLLRHLAKGLTQAESTCGRTVQQQILSSCYMGYAGLARLAVIAPTSSSSTSSHAGQHGHHKHKALPAQQQSQQVREPTSTPLTTLPGDKVVDMLQLACDQVCSQPQPGVVSAQTSDSLTRWVDGAHALQSAVVALLGAAAQLLVTSSPGAPVEATADELRTVQLQPCIAQYTRVLDAHVTLLAALSPPSVCAAPPMNQGARVAALTWDVQPGSAAALARVHLLTSLNAVFRTGGAARYQATLQHLSSALDQHLIRLRAGTWPHLLPLHLHCLLVALEVEAGPHISHILATESHSIAHLLTHLVTTMMCSTSINHLADQPSPEEQPASSSVCHMPAARASAACLALRALESFVGRPITFHISDCQLSSFISTATLLFHRQPGSALPSCQSWHGVLCTACSLLSSCMRHRPQPTRTAAPLLVHDVKSMLTLLMHWANVHHSSLVHSRRGSGSRGRANLDAEAATLALCASSISRVYDSMLHDKQHQGSVRMYCMYMLSDYITEVSMALPTTTLADDGVEQEVVQPGQGGLLPPAAAATLRAGALGLLGVLGALQLQALHMSLGPGWGGARRAVLAALKKEWEKNVRYTGKV